MISSNVSAGKLPTLLTDTGVVPSLLNYQKHYHTLGRSISWHNLLIRSIGLFYDFCRSKNIQKIDELCLQSFYLSLLNGTLDEEGLDPSGLCWVPKRKHYSHKLIDSLTGYFDWIENRHSIASPNTLYPTDEFTNGLITNAHKNKSQKSFLGHLKNNNDQSGLKHKWSSLLIDRQSFEYDKAVPFNEKNFKILFQEGFISSKSKAAKFRDQLILLLMHYGGLRKSEALHLWINDVSACPYVNGSSLVKIYHPEMGRAPNGWRGKNGDSTRAAYLSQTYGLQPRTKKQGMPHLGWKNLKCENNDHFIQIFWFPTEAGIVFSKLWREYLPYRLQIKNWHPYAWVSFSKKNCGAPYTLKAFDSRYKAAKNKLGLAGGQSLGLSPHSHRHAYGKRLTEAKLSNHIIKKCLHHSSLESQLVYSHISAEAINTQFQKAGSDLLTKNLILRELNV